MLNYNHWAIYAPGNKIQLGGQTPGSAALLRGMTTQPEPQSPTARRRGADHIITIGGTGIVHIHGMLLPTTDEFLDYYGVTYTTYPEIAEELHALANDPNVAAITLEVCSPGGTVMGISIAADAITRAAQTKPINALITGQACSAAYWLAAQAPAGIAATRESMVGCLGVRWSTLDTSKLYEENGLRAIHLATTPRKTDFSAGAPVTDDMINSEMELLDDFHALFEEAIAQGRPNKVSRDAWTGQTFAARRALTLGLIDQVISTTAANHTGGNTTAHNPQEPTTMSQPNPAPDANTEPTPAEGAPTEEPTTETTPAEGDTNPDTPPAEGASPSAPSVANDSPASIADLEAAFPNDPRFALHAAKEGLTLTQAKAAYCDQLLAAGATLNPTTHTEGAPPVPRDNAGANTTHTNIITMAQERAQKEGIPASEALSRIYKEKPELYAANFNR